jgi:oligopeptidase B
MTAVASVPTSLSPVAASAPVARALPITRIIHGDNQSDPYSWLRESDAPEVRAYLEAESAWAASQTQHTASLREQLYREMLARMQETDTSAPYRYRGYWYYTRTEAGRDYPIYCRRRDAADALEEVYLDQNILAEGRAFHALGTVDVSPDGRWLLYVEDTTARREYSLAVKDLESGAIVDRIPDVWTATAWADDNRTFFYTTADGAKRCNAVWRHLVGTDHTEDQLVFEETDVLFEVGLRRSRSGRHVLIDTDSFTSSEWWCLPTGEPTAVPRVIAPRRPGIEYRVDHGEGDFFILTNADATNFRVVRAPEADPSPGNWRDWLPHRAEVFVEAVDVFRHHVVVSERADGLRRLRVTDLRSGATHPVTFAEDAYGVFPGPNPEFDTHSYRFTYSSPVTPASVYDYDLLTGERALRKRQEIPSGYDPGKYEVRRLLAPARDGVRVPVSLLQRRGTSLDGGNPLLLYAYGAYGATTEPTFNSNIFSLVDRGFVFAIAHVRGGQELGRRWYDDGKMLRKMNTFHDFIDAALELIRLGYTRPDRLVASGASAGGLVMGVVANTRPDLFRAVVADVPFVDVINTMLDPTLPLTAQEWQEWGDPRNEAEYRYMRGYSPYDNVTAREYPWMLVTASLNDSQVMYWEPAKWVARLRATRTDRNPLLLRINPAGSHAGPSGRYDRLSETAFRYAFMLDAVGLAASAATH